LTQAGFSPALRRSAGQDPFYEDFESSDIEAAVAAFSDQLETTDPGMGTVQLKGLS
jgi:hypothetical protein